MGSQSPVSNIRKWRNSTHLSVNVTFFYRVISIFPPMRLIHETLVNMRTDLPIKANKNLLWVQEQVKLCLETQILSKTRE